MTHKCSCKRFPRGSFLLFLYGSLLVSCTSHEPKPVPKVMAPLPIPSASAPPVVEPPRPQNVLGEFQTLYDFKGVKYEGRAKNIQHVVNKISGKELDPGEAFSFNQIVGPRTVKNGFFTAKEIYFGEMVDGIGGGTCQVSSTLFTAVLYADLEITERRNHSRPLKYIGRGLDATVAFADEAVCKKDPGNCPDFKFKNPNPFPVKVSAEIGSEGEKRKVTLRILGEGTRPSIKVFWTAYQTSPFEKRMRKTGKFLGEYKKRVQTGSDGIQGSLVIQGGRNPRRILSKYDPVDEIWEVGLDFNSDVGPPWERPQ